MFYGRITELDKSKEVDSLFISYVTNVYVNSHTQRYTSLG